MKLERKQATTVKRWGMLALAIIIMIVGLIPTSTAHAKRKPETQAFELAPDESETFLTTTAGRFVAGSDTPMALYDVDYAVTADTPENMARQYLMENAGILHLQSPTLVDLTLHSVRTSLSGHVVRFNQTTDGIPVYKANLAVTISHDNVVTFFTSSYLPAVNLTSPTPLLSNSQARALALTHIGAAGDIWAESNELMAYHNQGTTRLVYRVRTFVEIPLGEWDVLIDAGTGTTIKAINNAHYDDGDHAHPEPTDNTKKQLIDGTGLVFDPDPLTSSQQTYDTNTGYSDNLGLDTPELNAERVSVTMRDITDIGVGVPLYKLEGPYAVIVDVEPPNLGLHLQLTPDFSFTRQDPAFEAAMTYYHLDTFIRYIDNDLGITVEPYQYAGGIQFDPNGLAGQDNSHYVGLIGLIAFGDGGVDDNEDSDVIHHEYGHALHDFVTNGNLSNTEGLSEGSGDYFAQSYNRSIDTRTPADPEYQWVYRWDGHNEFFDGRVTNFPGHYPEDLVSSIHTSGQIWATCLMRVWDAIGQTQTDKAVIEGLALTTSNSNQNDAANAFIVAAQNMGYPVSEINMAKTIFRDCGYTVPDVIASTDLSLAKAVEPTGAVQAGDTVTYTLTIANEGDLTAVGVKVRENYPAELTNVTVQNSNIAYTETQDVNSPLILELGSVPTDTVGLITLTGVVSPNLTNTITLTNTALVETVSLDGNGGNDKGVVANCAAPAPVAPSTFGIAQNGNDVDLAWSPSGSYDIYRSENPYFNIGDAGVTGPIAVTGGSYTDMGVVGNAGINHYYTIIGTNGCGDTTSADGVVNQAEFDFDIVAGTP